MGYDVHLVKPEIGGQQADDFSDRDWRAFQQKHPGVDYVYFANGKITCKNPSEEQLATLAKIAYAQGWRLRGDDGEYYDNNGRLIAEVATPEPGFFGRVTAHLCRTPGRARARGRDGQGRVRVQGGRSREVDSSHWRRGGQDRQGRQFRPWSDRRTVPRWCDHERHLSRWRI